MNSEFDVSSLPSPKIFTVEFDERVVGRDEVIEEAGVHAKPARFTVPTSIGFEVWTIAVRFVSTIRTEIMRDHFRLPSIDGIAISGRCKLKLLRLVIRIEDSGLRAERTRAARELVGNLTVDFKRNAPTMTASGNHHRPTLNHLREKSKPRDLLFRLYETIRELVCFAPNRRIKHVQRMVLLLREDF